MARTRHKISGAIDENTPEHYLEHPVLGKHLEVVGPDAKPYLPEMHRVSLPAEPTKDEIAIAKSVGVIDEAEARSLAKTARVLVEPAEVKAPDKNGKD